MLDITGLITFSNFVSIISIMMIVGAIVWLFGTYFVQIALHVPLATLELMLYMSLSYAIYMTPSIFSNDNSYMWGLFFALGLTATTLLTAARSNSGNKQLFLLINMLIHAIAGIYLESSLIAAVSVIFLMNFIGFHMEIGPGFVLLGYDEQDYVASATITSGLVTALGTFLKIKSDVMNQLFTPVTLFTQNCELTSCHLFVPGMLWFGSFVFFLSLLIVSSSLYCKGINRTHKGNSRSDSCASPFFSHPNDVYFINNIITIILSLVAILLGNLFNISQLSGFSGTFFILYIFTKYFEVMPKNREVWAWTTLLIGIVLYIVNVYYRAEFEKYGIHNYFQLFPTFNQNATMP